MASTTPRSASSSGQRRQAGRAYPTAVAPVQADHQQDQGADGVRVGVPVGVAHREHADVRQGGQPEHGERTPQRHLEPTRRRRHGGQDATTGPAHGEQRVRFGKP